MSSVSITLSFDDLLSTRLKNLDVFEAIKIDMSDTEESLSSFLVGTSLAVFTMGIDYSAIAEIFSSTLEEIGISMDDTGMITLKLASFDNYVKTKSGIAVDRFDTYLIFKDYIEVGKTQSRNIFL